MKKVLLSLSALVAATVVSASTLVPVYRGGANNPNDSVNAAAGFAPFNGCPTSFTSSEVTETNNNVYLRLTGSGSGFYVCGVNNGSYSAAGANQGFGYSGTASGYLVARIRRGTALSRIKLGLQTTDGKQFAVERDEIGLASGATGFAIFNIAFTEFRRENASGDAIDASGNVTTNPANYVRPTAADLANAGQINVILQVNSCGNPACTSTTTASGEIWIDDIFMSQNTLTTIPSVPTSTKAANIASSVVFPNPASDAVFANLNLKASNDVTVVVTDMMGRQVATRSFGRVTEINNAEIFNAASLAKGMYTVTYVLDGTPAKSDLVVVK